MQNSDLIIGCIVSLLVLLMYLVFKKYRYKVMMKELKKILLEKAEMELRFLFMLGLL